MGLISSKRSVRVGDLILKEVAGLLSLKVKDPRVKGATLTGIHLSNDLKHAKIYFSCLGDVLDVKRAQDGLDSAKGFIKKEIGLRLELRYTPDIVFEYDPSLENAERMERIFSSLRTGGQPESGE
jgi:ribosome-binding factor A